MKKIKNLFLSSIFIGISFTTTISTAKAQRTFNGQVANPFVFCGLPKPCKLCQPFRTIWEQICPAGQPTAETQKAYKQAVGNEQSSNNSLMTINDLQSQMTPAISSAYKEISSTEVDQYINWISKQQAPSQVMNGSIVTMGDYWRNQGISNYVGNASIRNTATNIIMQTNQKIVEAISAGTIPQNPKPWLE